MSEIRVIVIEPDENEIKVSNVENELETFQRIVGGYIENVRIPFSPREISVYVNEEGLMNKLPHNSTASRLLQRPIVGVVVITRTDYEGNNISLTDNDIRLIKAI